MIRDIKDLVELFTYLYCLAELFGKKLKISIYAVVFIMLDLLLMICIKDYGFPEYLLSLGYFAMFLYGLLYYKESISRTLVNCFLAAAIVAILQFIVLLPLYNLFFLRYEQGIINELLINIGCFLLIVICNHKVRLKRLSDFFIERNKLIVGVSILILCGFAIKILQMKSVGDIRGEAHIQMLFFIFLFLFVIYEWQKSKTDAERKKTQLEMNKLYYGAYDQLIMLVRERQHDMKTHINAILSMIYTTKNYEELVEKQKEYCAYVMERNEATRLVLSIGNPLIEGCLYSEIQEAESKDIKVDYQISVKEIGTVIPEYELVEMIGILFDNAIDALYSAGEGTGDEEKFKKIYISLKETDDCIELTVANTGDYYEDDMTERFFENGYSSKGKGRGIGLSKLKRMVHDRKGEIIVSNELREERNYLMFTIEIPKEKRQKQ